MRVQIGELTFVSKAEAIEHFQEMLYRYALDDRVSEHDARELLWLLERHPTSEQKCGGGIAGFAVASAQYNTRGFLIIRIDGSTTDFSYRKCIEAPPTALQMVIRALRTEVEEDIMRAKHDYFAKNGDEFGRVPCALTEPELLVSVNEADADHAPPYTFKILVECFLLARKIVPDLAMLTPPADNQFGRRLVDRELAEDWRKYHNRLADVRIVAKTKHRTLSQENRPDPRNRQLKLPGADDCDEAA